jgi:UDP-GlcNAc:undecaprenyl-phosphate/decaprenyl-phosphate GlcNAc-1-phosphate transferase
MTQAFSTLQRDMLVFVALVLVTAVLTPLAIRLALRVGLIDRPAPHKLHDRPTPYLGGIPIAVSVLAILLVPVFRHDPLRWEFLAIGLGAAVVATVGLLDDARPLPPGFRLGVQALAALGLWMSGVRVDPTGILILDLLILVVFVLAVTNAVNLLDNMDGISTGTVAIAAVFMYLAAASQGQELVGLMAIALAGACLGFLPYNVSPARIFLGDAGSMFMGFLLASIAVKLRFYGYPPVTRAAVPLLILAVPLFDMTLVVFSRWRAGRPIFRGGTDHSSHRMLFLGASHRQAALATYAGGTGTGLLALTIIAVRAEALAWGTVAVAVAAGLVLLWQLERVYAVLVLNRAEAVPVADAPVPRSEPAPTLEP